MDEADGKHAPPRRLPLDSALHPVVVVRAFIQHDQDLALLELQLIVVVRHAVVQSSAASLAILVGKKNYIIIKSGFT